MLLLTGLFITGCKHPLGITHALDGEYTDCLSCHTTGKDDAKIVPDDHRGRNNGECLDCHELAPATE